MATEIKRGLLVNLAKDMNEELGLDPVIDTKQKTGPLTQSILAEATHAEDGVCADDELKDASWATLKLLGVDLDAEPETEDEPEPVETAAQKKKRLKEEKAAAEKEEKEEEPTETAAEKKKREKEEKAAAAAAKKKPAAKSDAKDKPAVKKSTAAKAEWVKFLGKLIRSGKHTRIELIDQVVDEFPGMVPASIGTHISDSKNAKYNKYEKLVIQNEKTKRLSFQK